MTLPNSNWNYPTSVWFGNGRIQELPQACAQLNMKNPLFVTDSGLADLPIVTDSLAIVRAAGLGTALYSNVAGNPNDEHVMKGVAAYHAGNHDGVIAFGGGSGLDAAKAVALMVGQDGEIWDYEDVGDNWTRVNVDGVAPIIAVPTTAGTGSEVGRASVITDEVKHSKKVIFHPKMLPQIVILDPELTVNLPPNLTAWTGVDALVHAVEAYCAPGFHPMAEGIAIEAIRMIVKHLPTAVENGQDLEARGNMLVAAAMAATAFQKGLGSIHSIAHQLGAIYHQQHGLVNAIILPYGLKQNADVIEARMAHLCLVLGIEDQSTQGFVNYVLALRQRLGIPQTLADIGIDTEQAEVIGEMALVDPSTPTNAKPVTAKDLQLLFECAVNGDYDSL
ncbi:MAG: alcohol dehydrogenase [Gammaproteobacteria bacterium]|nr:MAG: alcohol dehydrogenase [Gammaproteobacteria bacterium]